MHLCNWHVFRNSSTSHALWKTLKFKLLYFRNEAWYQAENMQTEIFLKPLVADQDKTQKGSLVLFFFFCDVTCNPRIWFLLFEDQSLGDTSWHLTWKSLCIWRFQTCDSVGNAKIWAPKQRKDFVSVLLSWPCLLFNEIFAHKHDCSHKH